MGNYPDFDELDSLVTACNRVSAGEYILPPVEKPKNALFGYKKLQNYRAHIDDHLITYLQTDPAYLKLGSDPNFSRAEKAFQKYRSTNKLTAHDPIERVFARFLYIVSLRLLLLIYHKSIGGLRISPTRQTLRKAIKTIDELLSMKSDGLLTAGGWFSFSQALVQFQAELKGMSPSQGARAKRKDPRAIERHFIDSVIDDFLVSFGHPMRNVVLSLSHFVEYSDNNSAIDDRVREARVRKATRERAAMVALLRSGTRLSKLAPHLGDKG